MDYCRSRIALECHHFSDVLASTVLSIAGAVLMKKYYAPVNDRWFTRLADRRNNFPRQGW